MDTIKQALLNRVESGQMIIEQVPEIFKAVEEPIPDTPVEPQPTLEERVDKVESNIDEVVQIIAAIEGVSL